MGFGKLLKKIARVVLIILLFMIVVVAIAMAPTEDLPFSLRHKARPLTARRFDPTPERLVRGRYLVEGPCHCFGCHETKGDQPTDRGFFLSGKDGTGAAYKWGPYHLVVPNITPDSETGIGNWSDDQLARALREGIGHDGRVLISSMPYQWFSRLSDEDLATIIVYLRSLPAVRNPLPRMRLPLILRLLDSSYPEPIPAPVPAPDFSDPLKRGAYYGALGKCFDCHTPVNWKSDPIPGLDFAGGNYFPEDAVAAPNITPDPSGISYYDEAMFIQVMRTGRVGARGLRGVMPWRYLGHMTDEDLKAMFAYLRTLRPVKHRVDNTEPRTYCKLCRHKHGAGDKN